jgi:hypothetical protein
MKFIASLFLIFVVNSCSTDSTPFIPKDFDYPDNKIGAGKTFVYQDVDLNKYMFKDIKLINAEDQRYITTYYYRMPDSTGRSVSDSIVTSNGRTIEVYNFWMSGDNKIIKGEKLGDTILDNNGKLGKHSTKWMFHTTQSLYTTNSEEKYTKDTMINWQNQSFPCLVTQANSHIISQAISNSGFNYNTAITSRFYYAKGIGLIRFSTEFTDYYGKHHNNLWNLVRIRDIK